MLKSNNNKKNIDKKNLYSGVSKTYTLRHNMHLQ